MLWINDWCISDKDAFMSSKSQGYTILRELGHMNTDMVTFKFTELSIHPYFDNKKQLSDHHIHKLKMELP